MTASAAFAQMAIVTSRWQLVDLYRADKLAWHHRVKQIHFLGFARNCQTNASRRAVSRILRMKLFTRIRLATGLTKLGLIWLSCRTSGTSGQKLWVNSNYDHKMDSVGRKMMYILEPIDVGRDADE